MHNNIQTQKDSLTICNRCLKDQISKLISRKLKYLKSKHYLIPNFDVFNNFQWRLKTTYIAEGVCNLFRLVFLRWQETLVTEKLSSSFGVNFSGRSFSPFCLKKNWTKLIAYVLFCFVFLYIFCSHFSLKIRKYGPSKNP